MARRFGKFNPRQPRDKNGRWTSKGGGTRVSASRKSTSRRSRTSTPTLTNSDHRRRLVGSSISTVVFAASGSPVQAGIHATGAGTAAYRLAASGLSGYVNQKGRFSAAKRATFNRRKAMADKVVGRIEKAQKVAVVGAAAFGFVAQGAGLYNAGKAAESARLAKGPLALARTALKARKASRSGVYNITSAKIRR